jgi:hypothetical protein
MASHLDKTDWVGKSLEPPWRQCCVVSACNAACRVSQIFRDRWRIRLGAISPKRTPGTAWRWSRQVCVYHRCDRHRHWVGTPVVPGLLSRRGSCRSDLRVRRIDQVRLHSIRLCRLLRRSGNLLVYGLGIRNSRRIFCRLLSASGYHNHAPGPSPSASCFTFSTAHASPRSAASSTSRMSSLRFTINNTPTAVSKGLSSSR